MLKAKLGLLIICWLKRLTIIRSKFQFDFSLILNTFCNNAIYTASNFWTFVKYNCFISYCVIIINLILWNFYVLLKNIRVVLIVPILSTIKLIYFEGNTVCKSGSNKCFYWLIKSFSYFITYFLSESNLQLYVSFLHVQNLCQK